MPAKRRNKDDLWVPTIKRPKDIGSLFGIGLGLSFLQISDPKALSITLDWVMSDVTNVFSTSWRERGWSLKECQGAVKTFRAMVFGVGLGLESVERQTRFSGRACREN